MQQRMLIVQASDQIGICEVDTVANLGRAFDMSVYIEDVKTVEDLGNMSASLCDDTIDVVYLCGHADAKVFGGNGEDDDRELGLPWPLVSTSICEQIRADALVFIAACKGGLDEVVYDMFRGCDDLETIVGPAANVTGESLLLAFHVLLYQRLVGGQEDQAAALLAALASDQSVTHWAGSEVRASPLYASYDAAYETKYQPIMDAMTPADRGQACAAFPDWAETWNIVAA